MNPDEDKNVRALSALAARLKNSEIRTDAESLFFAGIDHSRYAFTPQAVVKIGAAEDVGELLKLANELRVNVSVRGGGTGAAGGALPNLGGWVLDLSALKSIEIDASSWMAKAGAGAITADIDAAAGEHGLFYPPDPSSHKFSSIGGNIACNAGGLRAAKYGVTRDYVLAIEGYLPTGEFVRWGRPLRKFSAGLNMRDLWVGSEGLLGVVTAAWLKLLKRPQAVKTFLFFYADDASALKNVGEILSAGVMPSIMEFMDAQTLFCARAHSHGTEIKEGMSALLVQLDGSLDEIKKDEEALIDAANARAVIHSSADGAEQAEGLWFMRRKCSQSMYALGDSKLSQDIVLPIAKAAEFLEFFRKIGDERNIPTPTFGHAADGNYHIHAMYNGADSAQTAAAREVMDMGTLRAIELGGAVSGEHGIGLLKTRYMKHQHSRAELDAMRAVKKALDPNNILNAGKVLEDFDISSVMPLKNIKLPWD